MPVAFSGKRVRPSPADVTHVSTQLHPSFLTSLHALLLKKQGQTGLLCLLVIVTWCPSKLSVTAGNTQHFTPATANTRPFASRSWWEPHIIIFICQGPLLFGSVGKSEVNKTISTTVVFALSFRSPSSCSRVSSWETWLSFKNWTFRVPIIAENSLKIWLQSFPRENKKPVNK